MSTSNVIKATRCPYCLTRNRNVYRSLPVESGSRVQYRRCRSCGFTFKTIIDVLPEDDHRNRPRVLRRHRPRRSKP